MTNMDTLKEFAAALRAKEETTKPFDTTAEVIRTEGSTAWVHIPGGVDETPVQMGVSVKPGDVVNVRVSGGRAWILGNSTRPPTDDTRAITADNRAIAAETTATEAVEVAEQAAKSAAATRQYFWHDEDGAHVSTVENDATTGSNTLIDSSGMSIRDGTDEVASFSANAINLGQEEAVINLCNELGRIKQSISALERKMAITLNPTENDYGKQVTMLLDTNGDAYDTNSAKMILQTNFNNDGSVGSSSAVLYSTLSAQIRVASQYASGVGSLITLGQMVDSSDWSTYNAISLTADRMHFNADVITGVLPTTNGAVTDLNDATDNGFYTYANSASNIPTSTGGCLLVMVHSANYIHQMALPNNANGTSRLYTRMKTASGWGAWTEH